MIVSDISSLADAKAYVDEHASHLERVDVHVILLKLPEADGEALARYIRERGIEQIGERGL